MRILLTVLVGAFVFTSAMLLGMYGTLSPCEMADKKIFSQVAAKQGRSIASIRDSVGDVFGTSPPGECLYFVLHP